MQEYLECTLPRHSQDVQPMSGIATWLQAHRRILRHTATLPKDPYIGLRAENVLNDMLPELRAIAD